MRPVRFKSTADYATAEIRQLILSGALEPGARLDQVELAKKLDVSRHPVRQAIERLGERGFVNISPHRSAVVAEISDKDMSDLYVVRRALEPAAIEDAFPRFDAALIARVAGLEKDMQRAAAANELDAYMEANRVFHLSMYAPCTNRHLVRTIESLFDLSERYQRTSLAQPGRMLRSNKDHAQMVEAIRASDGKRLVALIAEHNDLTQKAVRVKLGSRSA
jgi:DNA-binding GntR family transcriptional regulator